MTKDRDAMSESAKEFWLESGGHPYGEEMSADAIASFAASFALDQTAKAVAAERERIVAELKAVRAFDDEFGMWDEAIDQAIEIVMSIKPQNIDTSAASVDGADRSQTE